MYTIFSQQNQNDILLFAIISGQKSNFNSIKTTEISLCFTV